VQLLRTYPNLRHGRDFPFARGGERSVARGYTKAVGQAAGLVYVEDQYFWGHDVAGLFLDALRARPELRLVAVIPLHPDVTGLARVPELLGRHRALRTLMSAAPGRVAAYGIENHAGTPVYVHAKVCVVDDTWASVGSDNFNRRSWTHDSELSCVVLDDDYARSLRLTLAAEHLDRLPDVERDGLDAVMADCVDPAGFFETCAAAADRLDTWHARGRVGERPPGRLRRLPLPPIGRFTRRWAKMPLEVLHDPDGRPGPLRGGREY
jgi:phosphatidylserine/phosphatidylglycerophosphate/cardiolipin synthase-like enzyme